MTLYFSTKTYGHERGLSCCFRQWRDDGHCRFVHGYALAVSLEFRATELDERGWVMGFGHLRPVRRWLEETFDHTLCIAEDDPERARLSALAEAGLCQLRVLPAVGCEAFARHVLEHVSAWLRERGLSPRVTLHRVEVREHGANSAGIALA
ncbi:MAG: 6-carboxytetrahydropterin synthase [Myxococcales bacterium]|nr:6-carboxytetrahydropterin synthase [Myxococcales bacterium]